MAILDGKKIMLIGLKGDKGDLGGTYPLGETDGTAYEGSKGKANADAIKNNTRRIETIEQVHLQDGSINILETEQAYTMRVTADGAEIYDEQHTTVKEIKGSTVADRETNTLKHAFIKSIKSTGRNIWDEQVEAGNIDSAGVLYGDSSSGIRSKNYIRVIPNTVYYKKGTAGNFNFYDANKKFLGVQWVMGDSNFTTPNNCHYIKFGFYSSYGNVYKNNVCIKIADDIFNGEYEPYTEEIYQLPETLEVAEYDSFNPQTGELTRQTRRLDVDGVKLKLSIQDMNTYWLGVSYLNNYNGETQNQVIANNGFYTGSFNSSKSKGVYLTNTGNTHIAVWFNKNLFTEADISTTDKLNAYLKSLADAGNPLTVEYKLAAPTTEKIENAPKLYKVWRHGTETVIQGETDNSAHGAMPTIKNEYFV